MLITTKVQRVMTATSEVIGLNQMGPVFTISLLSSAGTRKIELSANDGLSYFQPTYTYSPAAELILTYPGPMSSARITGNIGDTYQVTG